MITQMVEKCVSRGSSMPPSQASQNIWDLVHARIQCEKQPNFARWSNYMRRKNFFGSTMHECWRAICVRKLTSLSPMVPKKYKAVSVSPNPRFAPIKFELNIKQTSLDAFESLIGESFYAKFGVWNYLCLKKCPKRDFFCPSILRRHVD